MKKLSLRKRATVAGCLFTLPFVVGFGVFDLYPLIKNLIFSFGKITDIIGLKTKFVGFANYVSLFTEDVKFAPAFAETLVQTFVWTPFVIVFAFFLALLLNRNVKGKGIFRVIFFLPVLLGSGYVMQQVGGAATVLAVPDYLTDRIETVASPVFSEMFITLMSRVLSALWETGVQIVIFLSGLQGISDTFYEAAEIDGAGDLAKTWKITLPLISPVILLVTVFTVIENFRSTKNPIANLIVNTVFQNARYEYGAAMGWVYFSVVLTAVGLIFLLSRKWVNYEK